MNNAKISLNRTCEACPEQYDALLNGKIVGYLRLRHGSFTVRYPNFAGDIIYSASPKGDDIFESEERDHYLKMAILALECELEKQEAK
jgi:hypothetical protein